MKASVMDLRYKMSDVLKALERNEKVTLLFRGKAKGIVVPVSKQKIGKITEHPFFGMRSGDNQKTVQQELNDLRKARYRDI